MTDEVKAPETEVTETTPATTSPETPGEEGTPTTTPETTDQPAGDTPATDAPGQAKDGEATPIDQTILAQVDELAAKKGWPKEKALATLLSSYSELEHKMGNWKTIEKKAQMWESAQRYLDSAGTDGKPDLNRLPVPDLARLWQNGQIGLADVPPAKQYQVQQFVNASQNAVNEEATTQANDLIKKYPQLADPEVEAQVATLVVSGIDPDEAAQKVVALIKRGEKQAELRRKDEVNRIKNGGMETGGSPTRTAPTNEINSVRDAFNAAKREIGHK